MTVASMCLSFSFISIPTPHREITKPPTTSASSNSNSPFLGFLTLKFPHYGRKPHSYLFRMAPDEEKLTRRSPLDFPSEWERPKLGRRPDIFPQFSPMKTPIPPPLPYDPPEEEEEEEKKKEDGEEEEDPEKEEKPDNPKKL